jgi:hypothetical protein
MLAFLQRWDEKTTRRSGRAGKDETMTQWQFSAVLLGVAATLVGVPSQAEGLRCGDRLASAGSSLYEVRATCGEPDDAQHTTESRTVLHSTLVPCTTNAAKRCEVVSEQTVEIVIDRWTYDFGSNRFIEFAHFEQGVLVNVTRGEHGHKDPT